MGYEAKSVCDRPFLGVETIVGPYKDLIGPSDNLWQSSWCLVTSLALMKLPQ